MLWQLRMQALESHSSGYSSQVGHLPFDFLQITKPIVSASSSV